MKQDLTIFIDDERFIANLCEKVEILDHRIKMEKRYSEVVEDEYFSIMSECEDLKEKYIDLEVENAKLKDEIEGLEILIEKLQDIILKEDRS